MKAADRQSSRVSSAAGQTGFGGGEFERRFSRRVNRLFLDRFRFAEAFLFFGNRFAFFAAEETRFGLWLICFSFLAGHGWFLGLLHESETECGTYKLSKTPALRKQKSCPKKFTGALQVGGAPVSGAREPIFLVESRRFRQTNCPEEFVRFPRI